MRVVVLKTGTYPDAETVQAALHVLASTDSVLAFDLCKPEHDEEFWDRVVDAIANAGVVMTL
ncbi:MAG: hypothetical protein AB1761_08075 [Pseudomonadota bacterium]